MTDEQILARIRHELGSDLPLYRAVDAGFDNLLVGLVRGCLEAEGRRREAVLEDCRRQVRILDTEVREVRRDTVAGCERYLRERGATHLADKMVSSVRK